MGAPEKEIPVPMLDDRPWQGFPNGCKALHCRVFGMQRACLPVKAGGMDGFLKIILMIYEVTENLQDSRANPV